MPRKLKGTRPRIGVDLHTLEGIHQGSRTHCFELFSRVIGRLPEIDFRFLVDTRRWDDSYAKIFSGPNAQVVDMPHAMAPVRLLWQLPGLVKQHRIDLLHTQYICPQILRARTAVTIHDIMCDSYPQYFGLAQRIRSKILYRLSAAKSDRVFTVSDYSRQMLEQVYRVAPSKIVTVYNAVDSERFRAGTEGSPDVAALGLNPGEYVLTVGRLEPRKNHIGLIRAMALIPEPRPKLVIVGQRDYGYEEIFALLKELRLERDVLVLESVRDDLLPSLYRNAKAVAYPSFAEGFGMPVLEAMASGIPVITSNTTSLPEVAGDAAILVNPDSAESICNGISRVLGSPELMSELRSKGLARAARFSWEESAEVVAATYRAYFS